jgi:hypothetical protein
MKRTALLAALALSSATALAPRAADAFCGFYAGGPGTRLYNHATQVVLMREGVRTVISMANAYEGPPAQFAMVVPVPVVLQKDQVKTLSHELFERIDLLDAPRLVEYWEQDPCRHDDAYGYEFSDDPLAAGGFGPNDATIRVRPGPVSVRVLNRFSAGEYEIVILGAEDSLGLEAWLRQNGYAIPPGAEPVLRPYVQAGMKFFVARVDPRKVSFERGRARLSPLRFHYDTDTFSLPIRLGLVNSPGVQDLVVHILARGQRYEVANHENLVIPSNLDVTAAAKTRFGAFYASLFDHGLALHPGAVVTEYAWDAASCDPCPTPALDPDDLGALGAEVFPPSAASPGGGGFTLTRLHARYEKDATGADLVFRAAPPIEGGREERDESGAMEHGARSSDHNNFQARYAIRHPWTGPIACAMPRRGRWGADLSGRAAPPQAAENLGDAVRGSADLGSFLGPAAPEPFAPQRVWVLPPEMPVPPQRGGCAGCWIGGAGQGSAAAVAFLAAAVVLARRRR